VRLHLPDGSALDPHRDYGVPSDWFRYRTAGTEGTAVLTYLFPWAKNTLDEAWFEFRTPDGVYWFEVPYGLARNPWLSLPPASPEREGPRLPPGLRGVGEGSRIVPWHVVEYHVDTGQADWTLRVRLSNPRNARCDLVLDRSGPRWEPWRPRTSVSVRDATGDVYGSGWLSIRSELYGIRRVDAFRLHRCQSPGREWGILTVRVNKRSYELTIPSSLYKRAHGSVSAREEHSVMAPPPWWDPQGIPSR
jgi:hypothetical protein